MADPPARSPVEPLPPLTTVQGWIVSGRRSPADLKVVDCTPLGKLLVRAHRSLAEVGVGPGEARRVEGALRIRSGPAELLLLGAPGTTAAMASSVPTEGTTTVLDATHALAVLRVTGPGSARLLEKLCPIDLGDRATPPGSAFTTGLEGVRTGVARDDHGGERSYLLWCERASGAYLFEVLLDAGAELGAEVDGFRPPGI